MEHSVQFIKGLKRYIFFFTFMRTYVCLIVLFSQDRSDKDKDAEDVAIKRVSKQACKSDDDIQGLFDEVSILQKIHHPHVMRLDCFFEDAKFYSLVTELVVGGELFDRIVQKNHYNELVARDLVRIFLETLDFLHSNGIVHRGTRPLFC